MRSSKAAPGNPWPHDMVIRIEDSPAVLDLLFARAAWRLNVPEVPQIEDPHLIPFAAPPESMTPDELRADWLTQWRAGWARYDTQVGAVNPPDPAFLALLATTPDSELDALFGGRGRRILNETQQEAFNRWQESLCDPHRLPLAQTPERMSLPALVGAWERGLRTIVQLPFAGHYAVSRNDAHLVVSRHTRANPELFTQALVAH